MSQHPSGSITYDIEGVEPLDWSYGTPSVWSEMDEEWLQPRVFDINIPIHPSYKQYLSPNLRAGDLVETFEGEIGIIIEQREPEGIALRIRGVNNNTYKVLVGDKEKDFIGYSLKKIEK